jgi:transcriptional regulator with XRE-family HTH domain
MQFKDWREMEGKSQHQVAIELGTTQANVSRWERGLSIPSAKTIQKIERYTKKAVGFQDFLRAA